MSNSDNRLKKLQKKLFIFTCYLILTGALLVYVTYGQYRLTVRGTVMMPQAYTMDASIGIGTNDELVLSPTVAAIATADVTGALRNIAPGDDAKSFITTSAIAEGHYFNVQVRNWELDENSEKRISPLGLKYELYIESEGILPLEFVVQEGGKTYTARTSRTLTHQSIKLRDQSGKILSGTITKAGIELSNEHKIYVGWNNNKTDNESQDVALSKEVDKITVRAYITALEGPDATSTEPAVTMDTVYQTTTGQAINQGGEP